MLHSRFTELTLRYPTLRIAVLGDFCLDRYFDIDPALAETSIETGLPVHNVTGVRSIPGAAGTIVNNLLALGVGHIDAIGFCGRDGEGYELQRALHAAGRVRLDGFFDTPLRRTFTYTKRCCTSPAFPRANSTASISKTSHPHPTKSRAKSSALSTKRPSSPTHHRHGSSGPRGDRRHHRRRPRGPWRTRPAASHPAHPRRLPSRPRRLAPLIFKMNRAELATLLGRDLTDLSAVPDAALDLARTNRRPVFITLAEHGIVGADAGTPAPDDDAVVHRAPSLPIRGLIDIVGAGDSVSANLTAALAAGADVPEAVTLANAAASIVIHQIGTTGAATVGDLEKLSATEK